MKEILCASCRHANRVETNGSLAKHPVHPMDDALNSIESPGATYFVCAHPLAKVVEKAVIKRLKEIFAPEPIGTVPTAARLIQCTHHMNQINSCATYQSAQERQHFRGG